MAAPRICLGTPQMLLDLVLGSNKSFRRQRSPEPAIIATMLGNQAGQRHIASCAQARVSRRMSEWFSPFPQRPGAGLRPLQKNPAHRLTPTVLVFAVSAVSADPAPVR